MIKKSAYEIPCSKGKEAKKKKKNKDCNRQDVVIKNKKVKIQVVIKIKKKKTFFFFSAQWHQNLCRKYPISLRERPSTMNLYQHVLASGVKSMERIC